MCGIAGLYNFGASARELRHAQWNLNHCFMVRSSTTPDLACGPGRFMDLSPANSSKIIGSITGWGMDMKASRFTKEQIIGVLREQQAGKTADTCRNHGSRDVLQMETKYGGLEVSHAKRCKALRGENTKLKNCWASRCSTTRCVFVTHSAAHFFHHPSIEDHLSQ